MVRLGKTGTLGKNALGGLPIRVDVPGFYDSIELLITVMVVEDGLPPSSTVLPLLISSVSSFVSFVFLLSLQ